MAAHTTDGPMRVDPRIARTRETVLGSAADLLAEHGWGGVTIEAVSARSGVGPHHDLPALARPPSSAGRGPRVGDGPVPRPRQRLPARRSLDHPVGPGPHAHEVGHGRGAHLDDRRRRARSTTSPSSSGRSPRSAARPPASARAGGAARGEIARECDVELESSLIAGPLFYRRMVSREPLSDAFVVKIVEAACVRLGAP